MTTLTSWAGGVRPGLCLCRIPGAQGDSVWQYPWRGRAGRVQGEGESQGESGGVQECGIIGVTRLRIVKASPAQHQGRCLPSSVSLHAINHLLLLIWPGSCILLMLLLGAYFASMSPSPPLRTTRLSIWSLRSSQKT